MKSTKLELFACPTSHDRLEYSIVVDYLIQERKVLRGIKNLSLHIKKSLDVNRDEVKAPTD